MAEMTASEAIAWLKEHAHHLSQIKRGGSALDLGEIAALIQQQAQTVDHQNLQIAKLQEDLIKAISEKE